MTKDRDWIDMDAFMASGKAGRRILVHAGRNVPGSKREFERFPPQRFPIRLHFLFSARDTEFLQRLKTALSTLPPDKSRHRKQFNRYTNGISFQCYFNDVAAMQPVMRALKGENLWKGILLKDERVSPQELVKEAKRHILLPSGKDPALLN